MEHPSKKNVYLNSTHSFMSSENDLVPLQKKWTTLKKEKIQFTNHNKEQKQLSRWYASSTLDRNGSNAIFAISSCKNIYK